MRFANGRLYVEAYIKCDNCGVLIYETDADQVRAGGHLFCTPWCRDWHGARAQAAPGGNPAKAD